MSSERRARADDEVEGSAALSNWLTDTLRPPGPEPTAAIESAPEEPLAEESEAEAPPTRPLSRIEAWDDGGEHTPLLGSAVSGALASEAFAARPLPAIDFPEAANSSEVADDDSPESERRAEAEADDEFEHDDRALLAPPLSEGEAAPDFGEPDPSALFLMRERSARRNQRFAVAAVVAFFLLIGGGYLLMRGQAAEPELQAAEAPVAAPTSQPPVAAKPEEAAPPESDETEVPEEEEEAVPGVRSGFSAALQAPGTPSAEPFIPGGPSTARYPDLPREVLLQLENAANTAAGTEQQP